MKHKVKLVQNGEGNEFVKVMTKGGEKYYPIEYFDGKSWKEIVAYLKEKRIIQ